MRQEAIQYLPLDKIVCEAQVRDGVADESVVGVARSIQEIGLQQPIRVRREGDKFVVVDGERRLRAARLAKLSTIPAIVEEKELGEGEVIQRQLVANIQRVDLSALEKARAIARLMEATGWNAAETAARLGISAATAARLTALLSLPATIVAQVEAGRLPASTAYEIAKIEDPARQAALAQEAVEGRLTRDGVSGQFKKKRRGESHKESVTASRVIVNLGGERSVTVTGAGICLETLIGWLEELLGRARKARTQGLALKTFIKMLRDQAKANA